jgi:integrase/recombinase XerD
MARPQKPFTTPRRNDSKTFQLTLNPSCGLPARICQEWKRRSFQDFPDELIQFRNPKTKNAAEAGAFALIEYLKRKTEEGTSRKVRSEDISVGAWIEKFTSYETSPRTGINVSKNRPYSPATLDLYKGYYSAHIKGDPITTLRMSEIEESDILEFVNRLSVKRIEDGRVMGGTRTFAGVIIFVRMAFRTYQKKFTRWINPFQGLDPPRIRNGSRDALPEDEVLRIFAPGVLKTTMELAVCAAMFLSGLRRAEISALRPEDLDWRTPKITIRRTWQNFDKKKRVLGPPKGKRERDAPFDPVLQEAVKKLWQEYGRHEWVFSFDGRFLCPTWVRSRFSGWLERAGIDLAGREIVPHSARHSLASLLEAHGVPIRYIQELLGHSDLTTTKIYLHSTDSTIRDVGKRIIEARETICTRTKVCGGSSRS